MYDGAMPRTDTPTGTVGTGAVAQEFIVSAAVGSLKPTYPEVYPKLMSAPIRRNRQVDRSHSSDDGQRLFGGQGCCHRVCRCVYNKENYRRMVEGCEDVIFAIPSAAAAGISGQPALVEARLRRCEL
jgi:hypothetical protein